MRKYTPVSGIYVILHSKSGKIYIGQSKDISLRYSQHKHLLNNNKHSNRHLQFAWNKYGETAFKFQVLEYVSVDKLDEREQHFLNVFIPKGICYNLAVDAKSPMRGRKASEETRHKLRESHKAENLSLETRRKLSESHKSENLSEETKRKHSEGLKHCVHKPHTDETRKKMSEIAFKRPPTSEETRAKMSLQRTGRTHSEESKNKMREIKKKWWEDKKAKD